MDVWEIYSGEGGCASALGWEQHNPGGKSGEFNPGDSALPSLSLIQPNKIESLSHRFFPL
jgi:hypothetical protein